LAPVCDGRDLLSLLGHLLLFVRLWIALPIYANLKLIIFSPSNFCGTPLVILRLFKDPIKIILEIL
jgi:hypothetical protein